MVKKMNRRSILFLVVCAFLAFYSCEEPSAKLESKPISDVNFNYLQSSKKFFVSALVNSRYMDSALDSVEVLWRGTNQQNTGDTLKLYDDGKFGDIIANDNIFSRRIPNSNTILANVIPASAKDSVFLSIRSIYKNRIVESELNPFILGNIHPKIGAIVIPTSVDRPSSNADPNIVNTIKFSVTASVSDANGLDDIKRVFFRSYHVGLDSVMNNGNPILLLDDGSGSSGSGDLQKGDGTYSRTISISENALVGTYHWTFEAQDLSNAYSDTVKRQIIVK